MKPFRRLLLPLAALLAAMNVSVLEAQIVQLTEDPAEIYFPDFARLARSAVLDDGTILVMWGKTITGEDGSARCQLIYRFVWSDGSYSDEFSLTGAEEKPGYSLTLVPRGDQFLLFWTDVADGPYQTKFAILHPDYPVISGETDIRDGMFVRVDSIPHSGESLATFVVATTAGSAFFRLDKDGRIHDSITTYPAWTYRQLRYTYPGYRWIIPFSDGAGLPVQPNGEFNVDKIVPKEHLQSHHYYDTAGRVWRQVGNRIIEYPDIWSRSALDTVTIPGIDEHAAGWILGGVSDDGYKIYLTDQRVDTVGSDLESLYMEMRFFIRGYLLTDDSLIYTGDSLHIADVDQSKKSTGARTYSSSAHIRTTPPGKYYGYPPFTQWVVYSVTAVDGGPNYYDTVAATISSAPDSIEITVASHNYRGHTLGRGVPVWLDDHQDSSVVRLVLGTDTLRFASDLTYHHRPIPLHNLRLSSQNDGLVVAYAHTEQPVSEGEYEAGSTFLLDSELNLVSGPFDPVPIDAALPRYEPMNFVRYHEGSRSQYHIDHLELGPYSLVISRLWRHDEFRPERYNPYPTYYQLQSEGLVLTDSGYAPIPGDLQFRYEDTEFTDPGTYPPALGTYDPNSNTAYISFQSVLYAMSSTDSVRTLPSGAWYRSNREMIPISDNERLTILDGVMVHVPTGDTIDSFSTDMILATSQRLYGPRFLRHGPEGDDYRLEVFDLRGREVASRTVQDFSPTKVVVGGSDSAVVLLWLEGSEIRGLAFNQALQAPRSEFVVAILPGSMSVTELCATFHRGDLVVAWRGIDSEALTDEAYITSIEMPQLPYDSTWSRDDTASVTEEEKEDEIESEEEEEDLPDPDEPSNPAPFVRSPLITLYGESVELAPYPNPTTGEVTVGLRLQRAWPITVRVYDALGRTVVSGRMPGNVGENEVRIDLSRLGGGAYTIDLRAGSGRGTGKVMIRGGG